jgi:hypothetical protein
MITVTPADEDVEPDAESAGDKSIGPEKKKKRKLLVNKPAFKWDPILEVRILHERRDGRG